MSKKPPLRLGSLRVGDVIPLGTLPAGTTIAARAAEGEFYATHPDLPVQLVGFRGIRWLAKDGVDG